VCGISLVAWLALGATPARAWGDEGHEIIALIADHYLDAAVRSRAQQLLAGDTTHLTATDFANESTWADRYRDSDRDTTRTHYRHTRNWHYVNLELTRPDLTRACFGRPPPHGPASQAASRACVVDKLEQFKNELGDPATPERERRQALQFVLHLVGDLHQPLHASDDHDEGGSRKSVAGVHPGTTSLHAAWDTDFVQRLGGDPQMVARSLAARITSAQRASWARGDAGEWALETFEVAREHAYGRLPAPDADGVYHLSSDYGLDAVAVTAEQLSRAGVRLAFVLNQALR
jgi:hypothetical protein